MDALVLANMLFQGAAGTALILMFAGSVMSELHRHVQLRNWSSTGEMPSVLELLEGQHAEAKPAAQVDAQSPAEAVRYG